MVVELDQHFLEDKELLERIVKVCDINSSDIVFEIGPGKGDLTKVILSKELSKLICVEKDVNLKSFLELEIRENPQLEYIVGNGLEELDKHLITKLIANIPYSITEPLYSKILDLKLPYCVLLHGNDFYKNIVERETKWKYFINAFYNVELIEEVLGSKFSPPTKVKSVFVKLTIKKLVSQVDVFYQNLWEKRKRYTKNALIFALVDTYDLTKSEAEEKVGNMILNNKEELLQKNLENLSNSEFKEIMDKL